MPAVPAELQADSIHEAQTWHRSLTQPEETAMLPPALPGDEINIFALQSLLGWDDDTVDIATDVLDSNLVQTCSFMSAMVRP